MARYGGQVIDGSVESAAKDGDGFEVTLDDGRKTRSRRLLITSGVADVLPAVDGIAERWGHDVIHCPYCHGWEVRDQAIGVLGGGANSAHLALLFRQLSDDVLFFSHTRVLDAGESRGSRPEESRS